VANLKNLADKKQARKSENASAAIGSSKH